MRVVIAGGGTGGHLFPGIAIAETFMARNSENRILFVGTGRPFETSVLSTTGFEHKYITAEGVKGKGLWQQAMSILKTPKGIFESVRILKDFKPNIVIGMGGYSAGPVVIGARLLGIKTVLHEQNVLPGITNRILFHLADRIYVSFEDTKIKMRQQHTFTNRLKKVSVTGNPIRKEILQCAINQTEQKVKNRETRIGKNIDNNSSRRTKPFTVLIIGGSQGAHSINTAVMDAIKQIKGKDGLFFVHQTGSADEAMVKDAYLSCGISCIVKSFYSNMAQQYLKADLIIGRAGAATVAEVATIGKGALFIPYPFASDNHQLLNARALSDAGAAEMILQKDLSGKVLAERIERYASNPDALYLMACKARRLGRPGAAEDIVDDCYRLLYATAQCKMKNAN